MGIPSYFSYIIKQYPFIIKKYNQNLLKVNNFYLDCNSIIYDVYNNMNYNNISGNDIELTIIQNVINKIHYYISIIKPNKSVIIAFDGVAPVSKIEQQRIRRYKSWYQLQLTNKINNITKYDKWTTASITPGTEFMNKLDNMINDYFDKNYAYKNNISNLIVSGSNIYGEGEHKIFKYIRDNKDSYLEDNTFIYGLDADLIMLCINHLNICSNMYLFRETPQFIKTIDNSLEPNENYYLDINQLTNSIILYLNNDKKLNINNKINDYIFICFLLGNDFLPHFPALNIRTGGIDKLLNAYRETIKETEILTNGNMINWKNLYKLIKFLANLEEDYIINETNLRNKRDRYNNILKTPEDKIKYFDSLPLYNREIEQYINPLNNGWKQRYYRSLFKIDGTNIDNDIKKICINYLEGLEWTIKYYTNECPDWRWSYNYHYPPLLSDLIKYIPVFSAELVPYKVPNPIKEKVQLCYVLPEPYLHLVSKEIYSKLITHKNRWYNNNVNFIWAYCRYFWECHVDLPEIDILELEKIIY
jgi:5'-3' exonuclease